MKKNTFKIIFDVVIALGTILMYKKNVLGLGFHELGGIAVCLLFIVHHLINRKWIAAVTKNLFSKSTPVKTRIEYIVDVLLCIAFLGVLITGIGISKKYLSALAFLGNSGKIWHFFFSGCALILTGIHIGLHWKWISGTVLGKNKGKVTKPVRAVCIIVFVCMMIGGGYALGTSSVKRWISAPFGTSVNAHGPGGAGEGRFQGQGNDQNGKRQREQGQEISNSKEGNSEIQNEQQKLQNMPARGGQHNQQITFAGIITVILRFAGILIFFAGITAIIEWLITVFRSHRGSKKEEVIS